MSLLILIMGSVYCIAQKSATFVDSSEIQIWPGGFGPGSDSLNITELVEARASIDYCNSDRKVSNITVPTLTPFFPDSANGTAVILCPGGAYSYVVYDTEGTNISEWFNSFGITAFVLKYRVPANPHKNKWLVAFQDAQRALRYVKAHADSFGIDSSKVGIMGASAGGHVASYMAVNWDAELYDSIDGIDTIDARPYFMVEIYPVISMQTSITHSTTQYNLLGSSPSQELQNEYSNELHVRPDSPISFFAQCNGDPVNYQNSQRMYQALNDSGVTAELHIYQSCSDHGVGICKLGSSSYRHWPNDCIRWLDSMGLAVAPPPSEDADLASITLNPAATLNPAFNADSLNYTVDLPAGTTSVTVSAATSDYYAEVAGRGAVNVSSGVGDVDLVVTADAGNTKTYHIDFTVLPEDVNSLAYNFARAFPNPAFKFLTVELTNNEECVVEIISLTGQKVLIDRISGTSTINIQSIANGMYLLSIDGTVVSKIEIHK